MGYVPPPLKLTREEFRKRISNGAQTMVELDPEFYKWFFNSNPIGLLCKLFKTKSYRDFHKPIFK